MSEDVLEDQAIPMLEMPSSHEAEVSILGSLLNHVSETLEECPGLSESLFWSRSNRIIFGAIKKLYASGAPFTPVSLVESLRTAGTLDSIGGSHAIFKLGTSFPPMDHVRHYAGVLESKWKLRSMLEMAAEIRSNAPGSDDADEFMSWAETKISVIAERRKDENLLASASQKVMGILDDIESGKGIGAIKTGISVIDDSIMGICPGSMDVYAAEAGCGKTSMIETIALNMVAQKTPCLIFQRDMPPAQFLFRVTCRLAGVSASSLRWMGHKFPNDVRATREAVKALVKSNLLHLYSPDGCSAREVKAIAARLTRKAGIKLVIVDHVRNLRHSKKTSWEGLEESSGLIRESVNNTGVCHIVLAHINREGLKQDRPTISNIKGGDQLKDDADNCTCMWLPDGKPAAGSKISSWRIGFGFDKTRWDFGGVRYMNFSGHNMRFEDIPNNNRED